MADATADAELLDGYVKDELANEWVRKGSFETRAFAVLTANLGLVTLFLAVRTQLDLATRLGRSPCPGLVQVALAGAATSIAAAVLSAMPWNYPAVTPAALKKLSADLKRGATTDAGTEVRDARVEQLRLTVRANGVKGWLNFSAFLALGVAVAFLTASLVTAASS